MENESSNPKLWLKKDVAAIKKITHESPVIKAFHKIRRNFTLLKNLNRLVLPKVGKATLSDLSNETLIKMHRQDFAHFPTLTNEQVNLYKSYVKNGNEITFDMLNKNLWLRQLKSFENAPHASETVRTESKKNKKTKVK